MPRDTPLKRTLFACDEMSGFIHACGLVRPDGIDSLTPKSVRKKLKTASFAAAVSREDVTQGAEELDVDLADHIAFVVAALEPHAVALGIDGTPTD
jgi:predicted hydrolase (HD superfamily)